MSAQETRIRALDPGDFESWLPLWRDYQAFYKVDIAEDVTRQTFERFLDAAEPMHAALAWQDEVAVGLVHWIFHRTCWSAAHTCYLQDLFVLPQMRGQGLGQRLIEHVCAQAQAGGAGRVYWLTHETNTRAMALYDRIAERSGFVQYRKALG